MPKLALFLPALVLAAALPAAPVRTAVLIDPGHGGPDGGVTADGFREADYSLALAKDLAVVLKASGVEARLTRDADRGLSLSARVQAANQLHPKALVSLHVNAAFQQSAQGPRVFVPGEGPVDEAAAPLWEQAARLRARESRALGLAVAKSLGAAGPRPVQVLKLGIFRGLSVPGCLVELGFATDPTALEGFKDEARRKALAQSLALGILNFLRQEPAHAPR